MWERIKGFRTFAAAGVLAFGGILFTILSAVGAVDLTPLVALIISNPAYVPAAMSVVGIFFAIMRAISPGAGGHDDHHVSDSHSDDHGGDDYSYGGRLKTDQGDSK
jgi:hypothetical protein